MQEQSRGWISDAPIVRSCSPSTSPPNSLLIYETDDYQLYDWNRMLFWISIDNVRIARSLELSLSNAQAGVLEPATEEQLNNQHQTLLSIARRLTDHRDYWSLLFCTYSLCWLARLCSRTEEAFLHLRMLGLVFKSLRNNAVWSSKETEYLRSRCEGRLCQDKNLLLVLVSGLIAFRQCFPDGHECQNADLAVLVGPPICQDFSGQLYHDLLFSSFLFIS